MENWPRFLLCRGDKNIFTTALLQCWHIHFKFHCAWRMAEITLLKHSTSRKLHYISVDYYPKRNSWWCTQYLVCKDVIWNPIMDFTSIIYTIVKANIAKSKISPRSGPAKIKSQEVILNLWTSQGKVQINVRKPSNPFQAQA